MVRNSEKPAVYESEFARQLIEEFDTELVHKSHNYAKFHIDPLQKGFKAYKVAEDVPQDIKLESWRKQASITAVSIHYK